MTPGLSFDDVLLKPKRSVLSHRADATTMSMLWQGMHVGIPIVSAPMTSVTDERVAATMYELGGAAIIPRQQPVEEQFRQWSAVTSAICAVGYDLDRFKALYDSGVTKFCLDVAHAHSDDACRTLRKMYQYASDIKVVAGAVATAEGAEWLADSGVDAVTVGIGPGSACRTREVTGFGVPLLTSIGEVVEAVGSKSGIYGLGVWCNGGIKNSGDIVKALAAGANAVIVGRLLAEATDAPNAGEYWGMAATKVNGHKAPEGALLSLEQSTKTVTDVVEELVWGIKSGISYGGGTDIQSLRDNAEFIECGPQVWRESGVRV